MPPFARVLFVALMTAGAWSFVCFLLLGTRYGSVPRLGRALLAFGVCIFLALGRDLYRLAVFGTRAEAEVVKIVPGRKTRHPVVRFVTADGQTVECRCRQGVSAGAYAVGERVPVAYLASDPEFAVVATWRSLWLPLTVGTLFGLPPLLGGAALARRRDGWPPPPDDTTEHPDGAFPVG